VYYLSQFGKVNTPQNAQAAFEAASEAIQAAGGGLLIIPTETVAGWIPKKSGPARNPHPRRARPREELEGRPWDDGF
jgi:hypothetical protein